MQVSDEPEEKRSLSNRLRYPRSNAPELVSGIHTSWNALRVEVDRRLRVALDEEAPPPAASRPPTGWPS